LCVIPKGYKVPKKGYKILKMMSCRGGMRTPPKGIHTPLRTPLAADVITKIPFQQTALDSMYYKFHKEDVVYSKDLPMCGMEL